MQASQTLIKGALDNFSLIPNFFFFQKKKKKMEIFVW